MEVYIQGIGFISPQDTVDNSKFLDEVVEHDTDFLNCIEPVYKEYIKPILLRRMSKLIKMGITTAKISLAEAKVDMPGAIISGTGLGLCEDTEKFLMAMLDNDEEFLTPTAFIQSTHNTLSGQIAIALECNNYNTTYSHRGFSFESALLDGMLLVNDGDADNVLIGGFDETRDQHYSIIKKTEWVKTEKINHLKVLDSKTGGSIPGEAVGYFLLGKEKNESTYAKLQDIHTFYNPESNKEIDKHIDNFLKRNNMSRDDVDVIITGLNGNTNTDHSYYHQINTSFNSKTLYFKHLCGEFHTSGVFAFWLGAKILKHQTVPEITILNKEKFGYQSLNNILIYNHYRNIDHSLYLLRKS